MRCRGEEERSGRKGLVTSTVHNVWKQRKTKKRRRKEEAGGGKNVAEVKLRNQGACQLNRGGAKKLKKLFRFRPMVAKVIES